MQSFVNDIKVGFQEFIIKPLKVFGKYAIPSALKVPEEKDEADERAWQEREVQRKADLKKNHPFLYLLERTEPFLMYGGFIAFLFESVVLPFNSTLGTLMHILAGGAMGLGLASWLGNKRLWKINFFTMRYVANFFTELDEALKKKTEDLQTFGNTKPKRAD